MISVLLKIISRFRCRDSQCCSNRKSVCCSEDNRTYITSCPHCNNRFKLTGDHLSETSEFKQPSEDKSVRYTVGMSERCALDLSKG